MTDAAATAASALARAAAAQPAWAALGYAARAEAIERFASAITADTERLAAILTADTGKPITQAEGEVRAVQGRIAFFLAEAEAMLDDETVRRDADLEERIAFEPLGVVVNISAWNYPWFVGLNVIVPALLTGNAVVYKPSELALGTGAAITAKLREAGVPGGAFEHVPGDGAVGAALCRRPADKVCFTGSHRTGVRIQEACAPALIATQLELGGKDALYVASDADPAHVAAAAAEGAFYNAGQSCCAVERIYCHRAVYEPFVAALTAAASAWRVGDPLDRSTTLGPLARAAQAAVLDEQVRDAIARGARVCVEGGRRSLPGDDRVYYAPVVLADATSDMEIMREESFGPVIAVEPVEGDEEAIARMRASRYGLTASVYTPDRERALRVLRALPVGSAYWNCCDRVSPYLPWSGRRDSGLGVTLGRAGIRAFTVPKAYHLRG